MASPRASKKSGISKGAAGHSIIASIIVPAYKEGANLRELVERVFKAFDTQSTGLKRANVEMIVVDDNSNDGSEQTINALAKEGYEVQIIVRTKERGLSSAVIKGFEQARGDYLLCMDADLQHPPESVPSLFKALLRDGTEFVIGTRYGEGVAIDDSWPLHRRVISKGARLLGAALTPLSDPMTGFFGLRNDIFKRGMKTGRVNPVGFKIAMELYVKCGCTKSAEVPFSFGVRVHGESKLTGKVIINYLTQLWELYQYQYPGALPVLFLVLLLLAAFIVAKFFKLL